MADEKQIEQAQDNAADGGTQSESGRQFTQAEVDALIRDRLERERKKFADYGDLKTKAAKYAEFEQAQKSEAEKLAEKVKALEAERNEAIQKAQTTLLRSAFVAEAAKAGAVHPEDAFLLADITAVTLEDDGRVTGAEKLVKALIESGRLPTSGKRAPSLDAGAGNGARQREPVDTLSPEELATARKMGLKPEQYAESKRAVEEVRRLRG